MKYLDRPDISPTLIKALTSNDEEYEKSIREFFSRKKNKPFKDRNFSITTLTDSPRVVQLNRRHDDEIVVDPLSNIHALFGKAIHSVLEAGAPSHAIVEKRLGVVFKIGGERWMAHSQIDLYDPKRGRIEDHKVTSAFAILNENPQYVAQLNFGAWLLRRDGADVTELADSFIFKNHQPTAYKNNPKYPKDPAAYAFVEDWGDEKTKKYILKRLKLHIKAIELPDDDLPECSRDEMWQDDPVYLAIRRNKDGTRWNERPSKKGTKEEVEAYVKENEFDAQDLRIKWKISKRESPPKRCLSYCPAAPFCNQFARVKRELEEQENEN